MSVVISVVPRALVVSVVSSSPATALPTAPWNFVVPVLLAASERAVPSDFTVETKTMSPAPASSVVLPLSTTASLKVCVPLEVIELVISVVPPVLVVSVVSSSPATALPTAPWNLVVPVLLASSERAVPSDFTVETKTMSPAPASSVVLPLSTTASLKVCVPVEVIELVISVVPPVLVVSVVSFSPATALPTAPWNLVVPVLLASSERAVPSDFTVETKTMSPAPASSVVLPLSTTASLKVCVPVEVIELVISVVPPVLVVSVVSFSPATALPTAPWNLVVPVLLASSERAVPSDFTVETKTMSPAPASSVVLPVSTTASLKVCVPLEVIELVISVVPRALVVSVVSSSPATALPTAPWNLVVPVLFAVSERAVPS